ncbi:short chain dehydrogenase/reductase family protein [Colletotrichum scovillei]|uniref:Short chain dehydrogenase/reductase family n=1 Tax=Colletotrichum scovillei TaxID=1209932 RepID=A0A9P7RCI8_9PEZI|nr:short chain dehydrogenase/reductase family protein [Colletotrichum scovillei]KAF4785535.1 short chain dehydrogenase/reductase family protein [Colletotrichum scovillei]KAG7055097.1 short chain dehydrogenase/reductase family [Colletotrichum scovillei]KAG7074542.1 short chain dehydrogenase/reductase family [Colletotrichum scovillei]KAG7081510.1 short chain dehydrogenase/reductase family [Colletotrichum scovillei]
MDVASLFNVKDKNILVTGGAKGIGYMISEGYVTNGATVYISSRDAKACSASAAALTAKGPGKCHAIPADLQKLDDCKRLVDELAKQTGGRLHVLVNNSGAAWGDAFETYPDAAWTKLLTLNLQRVFTLTQLAAPLLEAASSGAGAGDPSRIINIGSVDGLRVPLISSYAYSASKAGLHHLSRALARELGPRGITSNTLACGPFESKMMAATLETMRDTIEEEIPMRRIGTPQDVAGACLFLSGRAGAFVTGATITVDGGIVLASKL